jgi:MFS family permease
MSTGVIAWIPALLMRTMKVAEDKAGMITGLITFAVVIGTFIGGYLTDLWYRKNVRGRLLVAVISFPVSIAFFVPGILLLGAGLITAGLICMFIYGLLAVMYMPGVTVATQEVVHPRNKGMAWGLAVLIGSIIAAPGPWIIGAVSDAIGGGASGLIYGLIIPPVVGLLGVPFLWRSSVNYSKDRESVKDLLLEAE